MPSSGRAIRQALDGDDRGEVLLSNGLQARQINRTSAGDTINACRTDHARRSSRLWLVAEALGQAVGCLLSSPARRRRRSPWYSRHCLAQEGRRQRSIRDSPRQPLHYMTRRQIRLRRVTAAQASMV
jgi:uncharacterized membrane protein YccC